MDNENVKRKRGAQPGNRNALKHGMFSQMFSRAEVEELSGLGGHLEGEIAMMRVLLKRVFEMACTADHDLGVWRGAMNDLGLGAYRLANLLKVERDLATNSPMIASALSEALEQVLEEMRA